MKTTPASASPRATLPSTLGTSVSWLTTFFSTAAEIPRLLRTVRVYEPTGTDGSPITIFTPGFVRSSTVWICAGLDFGTTRTSVFVAHWIGFCTRPCLYKIFGHFDLDAEYMA